MTDKVLKYINEHEMLKEGDLVVAGVSGGADSVCLLFVLLEISKKIPIDIHVVHVNHLIREDAADDAKYVEKLCRKYDIPFKLIERDVEKLARDNHISTEEAGRNVRYEAFYEELGNREGKIAIAHNKNDCAETFLFNLFRGSALKGLGGIRPKRDRIIRPLLCVERSEIELYLNERNIRYCTDSTNLGDDYTRNKIRHHILDSAVSEISPKAVNNIANACVKIDEAYELIMDITNGTIDNCVTMINDNMYKKAYHIDGAKFSMVNDTIQGYAIMEILSQTAGKSKDIEAIHVLDVKGLMAKQCGAMINLPYRMVARRDYDGVMIYIENDIPKQHITAKMLTDSEKEKLEAGETIEIMLPNSQKLALKIDENYEKFRKMENIPQKKYTKWLDYDKIEGSIIVRTRKTGDYITVNKENQKKTLKSYMTDEKIPANERDKILLVANNSHIMWVIGARISNYYKITADTRRILCITYTLGDKEECKWQRE